MKFCPYHMEADQSLAANRYFVDHAGNRKSVDIVGESVTDYGIIAKVHNASSPTHQIVALCGIETFGAVAAMLALLRFDEMLKGGRIGWWEGRTVRQARHFEALVRTSALGQNYSDVLTGMSLGWSYESGRVEASTQPYDIAVPRYWDRQIGRA